MVLVGLIVVLTVSFWIAGRCATDFLPCRTVAIMDWDQGSYHFATGLISVSRSPFRDRESLQTSAPNPG